jgi:hypothetical protein
MAARASVKPQKVREPEPAPVEEQIRQRAYEIYLRRGDEHGTALDDWLQAEMEITHTVEQNYLHREEVVDKKSEK